MKNHFPNTLFLALLFCGFLVIEGHSQGFKGSLLLGANASQLDGDDQAGYHKPGLNAGIKVAYPIKPKTDLGLELIFSQRGSKTPRGAVQAEHITLNYFALPLFVNFKDWLIPKEDYYKVRVEAGITPAYLMTVNTSFGERYPVENFKEWDVSLHIGVAYQINKRWGFTARYTRSPIPIYEFEDISSMTTDRFTSYFLTFRFEYLLN